MSLLSLVAAFCGATVSAQEPAVAPAPEVQMAPLATPPGLELVNRDDLVRHATWLAADERRGRLTGTAGQAAAAQYIAEHFAALGLEPLGDPGEDGQRGFLQSYLVQRTSLTPDSGVALDGKAIRAGFAVMPPRDREPVASDGKLVLLDLAAKEADGLEQAVPLLLVKARSGKGLDINQQFGFAFSLMQRLSQASRRVEKAGGKVLVVGLLDDDAAIANVLNYIAVGPDKPVVKPGPALMRVVGGDDMGGIAAMLGGKLPLVFTGKQLTGQLLDKLGVTTEAARAWVFDDAPRPEVKTAASVQLKVEVVTEEIAATNVVAVLRGKDPQLASEAVVYSAHHDHVGSRLDGEVFNGADDNGSGSAGLLDIAEAYAKAQQKPRRSVVFLSVSGEELGLWGSAWYAEHPTWPRAGIVANINTDMIGRGGPDAALGQVMLTPSYKHPAYSSMARIAAQAGPQVGMELIADDKFYERSDHYNFVKKGIPAVFFCCAGEHADYHQVTDHADLLDPEQMEKTARLAYWVGWAVADADARPEVLGKCTDWLGPPVPEKPKKKRGG